MQYMHPQIKENSKSKFLRHIIPKWSLGITMTELSLNMLKGTLIS